MAITPLTVTIDLNPSYKKIPAVYVSQLDNNLRSLAITVQDGGVNYDVASSGYDVYVEGTKPDKHGFSYKVTDIGGTVVGSVVTVPMQTQMTCVQGMVPTEIVLKSGSDRIGSANFLLVVERAGLAEDVDVSETDIPAYIDGAQQAAAAAAQSAEDAEDAKDTAVSVAASIPADYTTLSNDVDDLKTAFFLDRDSGKQTFYSLGNFQHYGLKTDGTFQTTQTWRVSCDNTKLISFDRYITVSVKSGFKWGYIPFTNGIAGSWVGWKTDDFTIPANTEFVVQIARVTENQSEIADVSEFVSALTFDTETTTNIKGFTTESPNLFNVRTGFQATENGITRQATANTCAVNLNGTATAGSQIKMWFGSTIDALGLSVGDSVTLSAKVDGQISGNKIYVSLNNVTGTAIALENTNKSGEVTFAYATNMSNVQFYIGNGTKVDGNIAIQIERGSTASKVIAGKGKLLAFDLQAREDIEAIDNVINPHYSVPWESDMHRGYASATVAENTLPAFYRAWKNGADWIEADVRQSSDGVYVICHDPTVTVGGVTYTIANETAATLTALVLSTDAELGECKIPTLESVLKFALYADIKVNIDCKAITPATLAKLVMDCGMSGKVIYFNATVAEVNALMLADVNSGYGFKFEQLNSWKDVITDKAIRQKSYAWANTVTYSALEATRSLGFKYLLSEVTNSTLMSFAPDAIEFTATTDCKKVNNSYIAVLELI